MGRRIERGVLLNDGTKLPHYVDVNFTTVNWSLRYLLKSLADIEGAEGLMLNPPFQRGHVWSLQQKVSYVEHVLKGGRSGKEIYFNNPRYSTAGYVSDEPIINTCMCVDGLQRLTALIGFLNGEFNIFHTHQVGGVNVNNLAPRAILNINLNVHFGDLRTYREVVQWYLDLNTGGTQHTEADIERALNELDN